MQPGKGQMSLRLHTGRGEHCHTALTRRSLARREQTGPADAGLAAEHQRLTLRRNVVQD
jgi:hypothetical protein